MGRAKIVLTGLCIMISAGGYAVYERTPTEMVEYRYTVKGGDTIWNVAEKFATPEDDIRRIVYNIEKDSGIKKNTYLQPGQELIIRVPLRKGR